MNNLSIPRILADQRQTTDFASIDDFSPPHCVNPQCSFFGHTNSTDTTWWVPHGEYETKAFGSVPRFRCLNCGKTFSRQSFSIDYYVKKPVDYIGLITSLVSTSGQGNMTRFTGFRYELIENRFERLARFFLALHAQLRSQIYADEDFVLDGFESFSHSQYFPNNINVVVGARSEFIYGMGFAQLRRKGRMTSKQKKKRVVLEQQWGKARSSAVELSVASLLSDLTKLLQGSGLGKKELRTDEHKAYPRAFKRAGGIDRYLDHQQFSSTEARTVTNPLFPVNYVDRQFRKDQINHVRESVQFARCPSAMMIRLTIYQMYHNYLMPRRVRQQRGGNWETRGELLGVPSQSVISALNALWGKRVFLQKSQLWVEEKHTWLMEWRNSRIPMGRYVPAYIKI